MRALWCAVVGCPEKRQSFTPDGQELPDWLSWSQYVTVENGRQVTTGQVVDLPLTYYGPSIPLGDGWSYGGSESPTATAPPTTAPESTSGATDTTVTSEPAATTTPSTLASPSPSSSPSSSPTSPASLSLSPSSTASATPSTVPSSSSSPSPSPSSSSLQSAPRPSSSRTITSNGGTASTSPLPSSTSTSAAAGVSLSRNLTVILPSILVPLAVLAAIFLLALCLRKKREKSEEKRTAAFRRPPPQWEPVSTTDPPEKPHGPGGASHGTRAAAGIASGPAAVGGAHVLAAAAHDGDDHSSQSSYGDERSSLLHRGSVGGSVRGSGGRASAGSGASVAGSTSGLAGVGTSMGAAAATAGGLGLLRSLGLGRRPRTESPTEDEQDDGARNVSGNTMERMIGLVRPNRGSKRSSTTSGQRSGSGGTHNTSDPKRSSGGTSTGAYVPVPEEELFYAPRPIMDRSADSDEMYHSARSKNSSGDYDPGTVGTAGSSSSSSSGGHSGRSRGSKSSSSKSSRGFRGAGGRVHATIVEEGMPPTLAGVDLGMPETPTSASFSVYDSAGSGSGSKDGQDLGEFGTRAHGGSRLALPPGSAAGRYSERNSSVGTFGTPFDQDSHSRASSELLAQGGRNWASDPALVSAGVAAGAAAGAAVAAAAVLPWGAQRQQPVDNGRRSPFASLDSTRSGHRPALDSAGTTPRLPQGAVGMVPLDPPRSHEPRPLPPLPPGAARAIGAEGHKRSGSQEMMAAAAAALAEYQRAGGHQRAASHDLPERTPSPVKHSRNASASRALLTPLPGLNRSAPGPIIRPMPLAAGAAVGGDMMLSPFGPPPQTDSNSNSLSHPSTGPSLPSASAQGFVFPAPPDTLPTASTESLREPRHSGTTASADGSHRRGSAPRSASYDDFGVQQGTASRSEPTLVLLNSPTVSLNEGERARNRESSSSGAGSGWEEVGTVQRLGQAWNTGPTTPRTSVYLRQVDEEPSPFAPVEPVTPERARRGEFGSPRKLLQRLWR